MWEKWFVVLKSVKSIPAKPPPPTQRICVVFTFTEIQVQCPCLELKKKKMSNAYTVCLHTHSATVPARVVCKYLGPSSDVIGSPAVITIELSFSQFFICVVQFGKQKQLQLSGEKNPAADRLFHPGPEIKRQQIVM